MIELSRRWFVFGSAATLTAAAIPIAAVETVNIAKGLLDPRFNFREVIDIIIAFDEGALEFDPGQLVTVSMRRPDDDESVFHTHMNSRGVLRWVCEAGMRNGILIKDKPLLISCVPAIQGATVAMTYNADCNRKEGRLGRLFAEQFRLVGDAFVSSGANALDCKDQDWRP